MQKNLLERKCNDIDYNKILNREIYTDKILSFLKNFDENKRFINTKRIIFIWRAHIGKTKLICNLLKKNYDVICHDSSDIRNKNIIDLITNDNMSSINVHSMLTKVKKKIVIVMDDIDGMNNGDKGGINSLIKIIRPKKTKKQKNEEISMNPIICIGNNHIDKKIRELVNVCYSLELNKPSNEQIEELLKNKIDVDKYNVKKLLTFINTDLRRLNLIIDMTKKININENTLNSLFSKNIATDDIKNIVQLLLNKEYNIEQHNIINETDRTIVGLLWHENIIDVIDKVDENTIKLYLKILDNICFADYIDRITFQKQIWEFNEMSSLLKTIYNNKLLFKSNIKKKQMNEVRFTKVLTKYSTEYNNMLFINNMCQNMQMDKNDVIHYFIELREKYSLNEIVELLEPCNITKLDINRIYKYLSIIKYGKQIDDIIQ